MDLTVSEIFQAHFPVSWRIDIATDAAAQGADRVAWVPDPKGVPLQRFLIWSLWADLTGGTPRITAVGVLDAVLGGSYGCWDALDRLGVTSVYLRPGDPTPDHAIDVDAIADLLVH